MRIRQIRAACVAFILSNVNIAQAGDGRGLRDAVQMRHPEYPADVVDKVVEAHRASTLIAKYDRDLDGVIDATEAQALTNETLRPRSSSRTASNRRVSAAAANAVAMDIATPAVPAVVSEPAFRGVCSNSAKSAARSIELDPTGNSVITPLIRRSFVDVFLFSCPTATADARGAEFAYTRNEISNNSTWAVNGMAALSYQHFGDYGGVLGYALTPFVQIERQTNSRFALRSRNTDLLTGGFSGEIGFDAGVWSHYSRVTGSFGADNVNRIDYRSVAYEWLPVACTISGAAINIACPTSFAGLFIYRVHPSALIQYDAIEGQDAILGFSNRRDALRVGGRVLLSVRTIPRVAEMMGWGPAFAGFLNSFVLNASYHGAEEVYTGKFFQFFDAALTYNIDPAGFSGLTFSYNKGKSETTGEKIDLFKAALVIKY